MRCCYTFRLIKAPFDCIAGGVGLTSGPKERGDTTSGGGGARKATGGVDERYEADFYLSNFDEYEQGSTEPIVRGRMKANIAFWREIGAPDEILGVIDSGYRIPFLFTPTSGGF